MRQITIADIHKRLQGLKSVSESNNSRVLIESAQIALNKSSHEMVKFIESVSKHNGEIPFYLIAELFESVIETGMINDIHKAGKCITESIVHKARDSKSTNSLIKSRLTRLQNKLKSKVSKHIENNTYKRSIRKEQVGIDEYKSMLEMLTIMIHCDRVLDNYNKISKRFNLDSIIVENTRYNGIGDTVINLCTKIDTYSMPIDVKFNTVIETALYGFEKNNIEFKKSEILESALDYFIFKPNSLEACRSILESTMFFDKDEDMGNIDIITEEQPEDDEPEDINESIMLANSTKYYGQPPVPVNESNNFSDIFNKFKQEELPKTDKPETKLRSLVSRLYARNVDGIVNETPDLLQWIRRFFIIGTGALPVIGPVIMIISFIVDKFISLHFDREEVPKMIKCFNNEIKASKNKLKTTEDHDEKERLEKYIQALEKGKEKLDDYYNDLLTDKEQEDRWENEVDDVDDIDFSGMDYEDFMNDDDFYFDDDDFLESSIFKIMNHVLNEFVNNEKSNIINESSMYNLIKNLSDDNIITVSEFANRYPEIFCKESVVDGINDTLRRIRSGDIVFESVVSRVTRISALNQARSILTDNNNISTNNRDVNIVSATKNINSINEAYKAICIMIDTYNNQNSILEASITNTLKMASMKLKQAFTKMSDTERKISKSIDVGMNSFKKNIERALTNDNREAIIKGSILPSASKLIKLCLANAALLVLHQPLIAVIATLGYLGTSAKFKAKERQMVIDEIDIELEMCEKYISLAEQKNDMKALKELLSTKKELERQKQRIAYKMKVDFGQRYTSSKETPRN